MARQPEWPVMTLILILAAVTLVAYGLHVWLTTNDY
jgi:hypothetical protein